MGTVLDQFGNADNPLGHYRGTGPELWEQTKGRITHFVSSMGTTGALSLTRMRWNGLVLCSVFCTQLIQMSSSMGTC